VNRKIAEGRLHLPPNSPPWQERLSRTTTTEIREQASNSTSAKVISCVSSRPIVNALLAVIIVQGKPRPRQILAVAAWTTLVKAGSAFVSSAAARALVYKSGIEMATETSTSPYTGNRKSNKHSIVTMPINSPYVIIPHKISPKIYAKMPSGTTENRIFHGRVTKCEQVFFMLG